jgi:hypothetical protein
VFCPYSGETERNSLLASHKERRIRADQEKSFLREASDLPALAATIEAMRWNPRSAVLVVSLGINMQNKLEFAGLPFVEPPEPV